MITDYHKSGGNTALRVGNESSGSRKAGVFHSTTAAESTKSTSASHGAATEYFGRVFFCVDSRQITYYSISTGLGESDNVYDRTATVPSACIAWSRDGRDVGYCYSDGNEGVCPKNWGNNYNYNNYTPGCNEGSYYPNPTPAATANEYTGSRYDDNSRKPVY